MVSYEDLVERGLVDPDEKKSDLPAVIDHTVIQQLKLEGRYRDARLLLEAFREDVKRSGREAKNSLRRKDAQIKKVFGVCMNINCSNEPIKGKSYCAHCFEVKYRYRKKK